MRLEIKKFGNSMHIVLPKSTGFKVGDCLDVLSPAEQAEKEDLNKKLVDPLYLAQIYKSLEPKIQAMIEKAIEDAKHGY